MDNAAVTPGRTTIVTFDVPEEVMVEKAWAVVRRGHEVASDVAAGNADPLRSKDMRHWASGAWGLKPVQSEISSIQEYSAGQSLVVPLAAMHSPTGALAEEITYRSNTDLSGVTVSAAVAATGSPYIVKQVSAGATWAAALTSGVPSPALLTADIGLDRMSESQVSYPANQGYFLSWVMPGQSTSYPKVAWAFHFGQYLLSLGGTGDATFWEYAAAVADGAMDWYLRATFRYCPPGQVSGRAHNLLIFPHVGIKADRYISFANSSLDEASSRPAALTAIKNIAPSEFLYRIQTDPLTVDASPGQATAAGVFRFDIRRDLRVKVQISLLGFASDGFLLDAPAALPTVSSGISLVDCYAHQSAAPGTTIVTSLFDADSGASFNAAYHTKPQAKIQMTSTGSSTPLLWGLQMERGSVHTLVAPGAFTGGSLRSVNVMGYTGDPSQQSASVVIEDASAALPRLRVRGQFSVRIDVQDIDGIVTLFRGYVNRPNNTRKGRGGAPGSYPDGDWQSLNLPMAGMWMRLCERVEGPEMMSKYGMDNPAILSTTPTGADGAFIPWKVTDVVSDLLLSAGFSPAQINIPDLPIRIYPGASGKTDDFAVNPNTDFSEMAQRLIRNYLGGYLCFDENAGGAGPDSAPVGQWGVLFGISPLAASPIFSFVLDPSRGGVPHSLSSYPSGTAPVFGRFTTTNIPPEFNAVCVQCPIDPGNPASGVVEQWCYNYLSYAVPGATTAPDPASPEYLGRFRPVFVIDPSLAFSGSDFNLQATQAAVDWTAHRIYDFTCHAQQLVTFKSPLVFVTDSNTGKRRPLRFYDPVLFNGNLCFIKYCNPRYTTDNNQQAEYQIIQPLPTQVNISAGVASLTFHQSGAARHALKSTGHWSQSNRFGVHGVPAHREHQAKDLPKLISYQSPLQNSDGLFYDTADYGLAEGGIAR